MEKISGFLIAKRIWLSVLIVGLAATVTFAVPLLPTILPAGTVFHAYGGFSLTSATITIGSSSTWYKIKNATDNLWVLSEGAGISIVTDNLVFAHKGDYVGQLSISISGTNGDDIFVRAFNVTDNVATGSIIGSTATGATNFANISLPLYLEIATDNTKVRFEIENISAGRDAIVRSAVFNIFYLHD